MNVLIFGYGLEGGGFENAVYYLNRKNNVRVTDIREEISLGESAQYLKSRGVEIVSGKHRIEDFKWADLVVKMPSIGFDNEYLWHAKKVTSDFAQLFSNSNAKKVKLICVTGSKGKAKVSSAICHVINQMGHKCRMCGNMGVSPFEELGRWEVGDIPEYLVCEFSKVQIPDTFVNLGKKFPKFEFVVLTEDNVTDDFVSSRLSLLAPYTKVVVCNKQTKYALRRNIDFRKMSISCTDGPFLSVPENVPTGMDDIYKTVKCMGFSSKDILQALVSYKGMPNRCEIVKNADNLLVVNDSGATFPEVVGFSVNNFQGLPVHLICGGTESNLSALPMLEAIKSCASVHLLDGSFTRTKLVPLLEKENVPYSGPYAHICDAVDDIRKIISENKTNNKMEVVLLSPGASAFEYFASVSDRGEQFKNCFK